MKYKLPMLLLGLLILSCDTANPWSAIRYTESPVLQGFLYAGRPVRDIRLTYTANLRDQRMDPMLGADVKLWRNQEVTPYTLESTPGKPGFYHDATGDIEVAEGDTFTITVYRDPITLRATTVVPERPKLLPVQTDTLVCAAAAPYSIQSMIQIQWQSDIEENARFFVDAEFEDSGILTRFPPYFIDSDGNPSEYKWIFNQYAIYPDFFSSHREVEKLTLWVYRVHPELTDLYDATNTRTLPDESGPSNIEGGKGIFTALAGDSVNFVVLFE